MEKVILTEEQFQTLLEKVLDCSVYKNLSFSHEQLEQMCQHLNHSQLKLIGYGVLEDLQDIINRAINDSILDVSLRNSEDVAEEINLSLNSIENKAFQIFRERLTTHAPCHKEEIINMAEYAFFAATLFEQVVETRRKQEYYQSLKNIHNP